MRVALCIFCWKHVYIDKLLKIIEKSFGIHCFSFPSENHIPSPNFHFYWEWDHFHHTFSPDIPFILTKLKSKHSVNCPPFPHKTTEQKFSPNKLSLCTSPRAGLSTCRPVQVQFLCSRSISSTWKTHSHSLFGDNY